MNYRLVLSLLVTLGILETSSEARTVYFGTQTETIPLIYGGPTILRFPSEVRTISQAQKFQIEPANAEQPNYALLSVQPRFMTGSSDVAFILNDGTIIKTRLTVISKPIPEKTDSIYDFKSKENLLQKEDSNQPGASLPEFELMKAVIRDDAVAGYEVKSLTRTLTPGFKGVTIKLVRIYTGNQFNGYVFEITNITKDQKLFINVQNLILGDPNLALLSMIDQNVIEPVPTKNKTYLRIIAKSTSIYNELKLPIQVVSKEGKI